MSNKPKTMKMREDHTWRCKPGNTIFVADRGAVRFDIPRDWSVVVDGGPAKIYDKAPPDDNCVLQLSIFHLPPGIDWTELPIDKMLYDATSDDRDGTVLTRGDVIYKRRRDLEYAWRESRFMDPEEERPAYSRTCVARGSNIQPLITFEFWPEDRERLVPVWDEVVRSLRLGQYVKDPTRGPGF